LVYGCEVVIVVGDYFVLVVDVDVVLVCEFVFYCCVDVGVGCFDFVECFVGEDDVEVECVVSGVVFLYCDVVMWFELFG